MRGIILFAPLALLLFTSTKCKRECNDVNPGDCANVACTMDFRAVTVTINGANGQGVLIDSTITVDQNGQKLSNMELGIGSSGSYTVVDDHYVLNHKNVTETVKFYAYRNGALVAQADFVVSADCCHVSKVSGPDNIAAQ